MLLPKQIFFLSQTNRTWYSNVIVYVLIRLQLASARALASLTPKINIFDI